MNSATSSQDTVDTLGKFIFNCIFVRTGRQDNINTEVWIGTGVPRRAYHKEVVGKRTHSITVQFEQSSSSVAQAAQEATLLHKHQSSVIFIGTNAERFPCHSVNPSSTFLSVDPCV